MVVGVDSVSHLSPVAGLYGTRPGHTLVCQPVCLRIAAFLEKFAEKLQKTQGVLIPYLLQFGILPNKHSQSLNRHKTTNYTISSQ